MASGSVMVAKQARGRGMGRALTIDMIGGRGGADSRRSSSMPSSIRTRPRCYFTRVSGSSLLGQPQEHSGTPSWAASASVSCGWTCAIRATPRTDLTYGLIGTSTVTGLCRPSAMIRRVLGVHNDRIWPTDVASARLPAGPSISAATCAVSQAMANYTALGEATLAATAW